MQENHGKAGPSRRRPHSKTSGVHLARQFLQRSDPQRDTEGGKGPVQFRPSGRLQ